MSCQLQRYKKDSRIASFRGEKIKRLFVYAASSLYGATVEPRLDTITFFCPFRAFVDTLCRNPGCCPGLGAGCPFRARWDIVQATNYKEALKTVPS